MSKSPPEKLQNLAEAILLSEQFRPTKASLINEYESTTVSPKNRSRPALLTTAGTSDRFSMGHPQKQAISSARQTELGRQRLQAISSLAKWQLAVEVSKGKKYMGLLANILGDALRQDFRTVLRRWQELGLVRIGMGTRWETSIIYPTPILSQLVAVSISKNGNLQDQD